tara:strand:- start:37590 stop:37820 length:231 start_codon:yes stop_codon:yes gene_type:complete
MAYYTATTEFSPYNTTDGTALLVVDAGTGTISLEVQAGAAWIVQEVFTTDSVKRVYIGGGTWRCVVTGDAAFEWVV